MLVIRRSIQLVSSLSTKNKISHNSYALTGHQESTVNTKYQTVNVHTYDNGARYDRCIHILLTCLRLFCLNYSLQNRIHHSRIERKESGKMAENTEKARITMLTGTNIPEYG